MVHIILFPIRKGFISSSPSAWWYGEKRRNQHQTVDNVTFKEVKDERRGGIHHDVKTKGGSKIQRREEGLV